MSENSKSEHKESRHEGDGREDHAPARSASEPEESQQPEASDQQAQTLSADHEQTASAASPAESAPPPRRGGNALAWLALLLALAAGGLAGWQWWVDRQGAGSSVDSAALAARIDEQAGVIESRLQDLDQLGDRVGELDSRLVDLSSRLGERGFDPAELRSELEQQSDSVVALHQQLESTSSRLDEAMADLESRIEQAGQDRSEGIDESLARARFRLGLIEVAGLLRLGQSRAELAADPAGAVAAYTQAQSRLDQVEDGRLERLRQLLGQELEALRSLDGPDWAALSGRLVALENGAARWPLARSDEQLADPATVGDAGQSDAGGDGGEGWWSGLRHSLAGLVRITPRESAPLSPAAVESVRERVRLHLAAAQAAAARRNGEEMKRQLEAVEQLIRSHFDTSAEAVAQALQTISSTASTRTPPLPGLGGALAEAERRLAAS